MDYDNFTNSKYLGWFDTGPWHNKKKCSKLYGTTFEGFIKQARTDRYNIMCSLVAHDSIQDNEQDDESSPGDIEIPIDATVKALNSLGATFNFIDIWLHNFCRNYFDRSESYTAAMIEMFKTIPPNVGKPLTTREKNQKLITDIGGGWYLEKCQKGIPPLKRTKLGKKSQKRQDIIKNKLFQSNMCWNDCKSQLHWNMLEWVDPKTVHGGLHFSKYIHPQYL